MCQTLWQYLGYKLNKILFKDSKSIKYTSCKKRGTPSNNGVFKVLRKLPLVWKGELGREDLLIFCSNFPQTTCLPQEFPAGKAKILGIIHELVLVFPLHSHIQHIIWSSQTLPLSCILNLPSLLQPCCYPRDSSCHSSSSGPLQQPFPPVSPLPSLPPDSVFSAQQQI